jgi:hypothetical protein
MGSSASKSASSTAKAAQSANRTAAQAGSQAIRQTTARGQQQGGEARNINIKGEPVTPSSEMKTKAVLKDASDPSAGPDMLSRNLASLGQASAQKHNASRFTPVRFDDLFNTLL